MLSRDIKGTLPAPCDPFPPGACVSPAGNHLHASHVFPEAETSVAPRGHSFSGYASTASYLSTHFPYSPEAKTFIAPHGNSPGGYASPARYPPQRILSFPRSGDIRCAAQTFYRRLCLPGEVPAPTHPIFSPKRRHPLRRADILSAVMPPRRGG